MDVQHTSVVHGVFSTFAHRGSVRDDASALFAAGCCLTQHMFIIFDNSN